MSEKSNIKDIKIDKLLENECMTPKRFARHKDKGGRIMRKQKQKQKERK